MITTTLEEDVKSLTSQELKDKYKCNNNQVYVWRKKFKVAAKVKCSPEDLETMTIPEIMEKYKLVRYQVSQRRRNYTQKTGFTAYVNLPHELYSDQDFFKEIDSEEKAWLLGWVATDGHATDRQLCWSLQRRDEEVLLKFKTYLKFEGTIKQFTLNDKYEVSRLCIGGKELCNSLAKYGMQGNKTFTVTFPDIPDNLKRHFIRGCFEGDGNFNEWHFNICGVSPLVTQIFEEMSKATGLKFKENTSRENLTLLYGNKDQWEAVRWMYKDATCVLDRKYQHFLSMEAKLK